MSSVIKAETRHVLFLNTYNWQIPWQQKIMEGFNPTFTELSELVSDNIILHIETIDTIHSKLTKPLYQEYLTGKYNGLHFDLIIANDYAALEFTDTYLWNKFNSPQVLTFSDISNINKVKNIQKLGYISPGKIRFSDTLSLIRKLHPHITKIHVITGKSANTLRFKKIIEEEAHPQKNRESLDFWVDVTYDDMIKRTKNLNSESVILFLPFMLDRGGNKYIPVKVLKEIAAVSPVPIYSAWDTFIGSGITGGRVLSAEMTGSLLAKHTLDIISGKPSYEIRYTPEEIHSYIFDGRKLHQFGIPESFLPKGSLIKFRTVSFWEKYRLYIILGISFIFIETMLLVFLFINRSKLISTENQLRDSYTILEKRVRERTQELTQSNSDLLISEEKFRSLSDAAFEGIVITDNDNIIEANTTLCHMFGYLQKEIIGMSTTCLIVPEDHDIIKNRILSDSEKTDKLTALRKDNSTFSVEVQSKSFLYKGHKARVTAVRDITDQKKAEKEKEILIGKLQNALKEIKSLKGIVPICSSCKKIRDDKGYWNLLEIYLEKHSDASFSHGICPECTDKLYGDQDWYRNMKKGHGNNEKDN